MNITNYSQSSLSTISEVSCLSKEDLEFVTAAASELQETFEKRQIFRTETEMYISVLDDIHFPNQAAKYWQAVREQAVMFENLVTISFEYRRN
jgi:hypothetical protein